MNLLRTANIVFISTMLAVLFLGAGSISAMSRIYDNPRVLILAGADEIVTQQIEILREHIEGLHDRDILVLSLSADQKSLEIISVLSDPDFMKADLQGYGQYIDRIKETDFMLLLIGKDGGLKEKWLKPVQFTRISNLIDQMPMRRIEMREN